MNPRKLKPYVKAFELKMEMERQNSNTIAYIQGIYVRDALLCTVGNMLKGKGKNYEYPKEMYDFFGIEEKKKQNHVLTEEEKLEQTKALFTRLNLMKANWELTHPSPDSK